MTVSSNFASVHDADGKDEICSEYGHDESGKLPLPVRRVNVLQGEEQGANLYRGSVSSQRLVHAAALTPVPRQPIAMSQVALMRAARRPTIAQSAMPVMGAGRKRIVVAIGSSPARS